MLLPWEHFFLKPRVLFCIPQPALRVSQDLLGWLTCRARNPSRHEKLEIWNHGLHTPRFHHFYGLQVLRRIFYRVYILFAQRDDPLGHLNECDDAGGKAKRSYSVYARKSAIFIDLSLYMP